MEQLDQFYTPFDTAKKCIALIPNIAQYDLIIEPSAGTGSFSTQISDCLAYDIDPKHESIIEKNFLMLKIEQKFNHLLIVGNPPFGVRSALAKQFIKYAQQLKAETIAFILPETFSKLSNQSLTLFPKEWHLILNQPLTAKESTFIYNDKSYYVPCGFYIWTKQNIGIDLREVKVESSNDFIFCTRGDLSADFSINGNTGKVKLLSEITNSKAEHYIKAKNKSKEQLMEIFSNITYSFFSSVSGKNAWIGQQEILKAYNEFS